ncbi:hypothetical protein CFC21_002350 [Triticum aestivum]|uniref:Embryo surrounding factor 1 brassicaceae domain-containing protein n=2 Tax=Triticum TaxID=4564 RepID=A0A3B5Y0J0_WHEAT|nr:hypothetical protein CFC21_002350 [Triticum aestivum]
MKGGSMVYMTVLFIGCLLMVGQCRRPEPESIYEDGRANTTMAVSSLDDSKITVKFCLPRNCTSKGEFWGWDPECYCCLTKPGVPCFHTAEECQKKCPPLK